LARPDDRVPLKLQRRRKEGHAQSIFDRISFALLLSHPSMAQHRRILNWFEIPTTDLARAQRFYEQVFQIKMERMDLPNLQMVTFPMDSHDSPVTGGALVKSEFHTPSDSGVLIYLNGDPDLNVPLGRVEEAGGRIMMHKTKISDDVGYMAFIKDSEGNSIAFHSIS
jgi:predicted enzyme related to lactoylglutathione lyase